MFLFNSARILAVRFGGCLFEFVQLLIEVLVKLHALDNRSIRLLELLAVEADKDGLDIVD